MWSFAILFAQIKHIVIAGVKNREEERGLPYSSHEIKSACNVDVAY